MLHCRFPDRGRGKISGYCTGGTVSLEVTPKNFGRIAAQKAKQVVVQKIREEERKVLFDQYYTKERDIVTGIVQRYSNGNYNINLGKMDAMLTSQEQVETEKFSPRERIKLYVTEVRDTTRGPRVIISRTHPELVKRLFEYEVAEIQSGVVEIKNVSARQDPVPRSLCTATIPTWMPLAPVSA